MAVVEPVVVYPERVFQRAVVGVINDVLNGAGQRFQVVEGFGLDIAVFIDAQAGTSVRFFEVKSFGAQRMGGVGFGNRHGSGAQVALLGCLADQPTLLDPIVRWIYAEATRPHGSPRYALFTCATAKRAAMGGMVAGKQNNLKISALHGLLVDWTQLCSDVRAFLLAVQ